MECVIQSLEEHGYQQFSKLADILSVWLQRLEVSKGEDF